MKKCEWFFILPVLILVHANSVLAAEPNSVWPSLGGDFGRTGQSSFAGPTQGAVQWAFEIEGSVWASVTIGVENRVHIASKNGKLYTLNDQGTLLWQYDANTPLLSAPSVGPDGTVYVGGQDGGLYAVDTNGQLRWTYETDGFIYSSPAVSADGTIYVGSKSGDLYALHPDGSEKWRFASPRTRVLSEAIVASPALGPDGTVYIGSLYDPNLYALNPDNGEIKWTCHFPPTDPNSQYDNRWIYTSPVVGPNDTIYQVLLYDPHLYAIDAKDGSIRWSTHLSDTSSEWFESEEPRSFEERLIRPSRSAWTEPVLGPDGTIYVNFDDPHLRAVDPNGTIKWVTQLGSSLGFTLCTDAEGRVYAAGEENGVLHVIDPNGVEISRLEVENQWLSYPVVSAEGTLIVSQTREADIEQPVAANVIMAIAEVGPFLTPIKPDDPPEPPINEPNEPTRPSR